MLCSLSLGDAAHNSVDVRRLKHAAHHNTRRRARRQTRRAARPQDVKEAERLIDKTIAHEATGATGVAGRFVRAWQYERPAQLLVREGPR